MWKVKVKSLSHVGLFVTPWTVTYQSPLSMGFPGYSPGVHCHFLLQENLPKLRDQTWVSRIVDRCFTV